MVSVIILLVCLFTYYAHPHTLPVDKGDIIQTYLLTK